MPEYAKEPKSLISVLGSVLCDDGQLRRGDKSENKAFRFPDQGIKEPRLEWSNMTNKL